MINVAKRMGATLDVPLEISDGRSDLPGPDVPLRTQRARTVGIISFLTLVVAVLGYFREATLAARFGVSATMDAYFGAVFIPNILYLVLVLGTLSPVFIPILLQEDISGDRARISSAFSAVTNFLLIVLLGVVGCAMLTGRYWLPSLFPGFATETIVIALRLTYIIFPAVVFLGLSGILAATLNAFHKFALPAFAPALSSIAIIAAVLVSRGERAIYFVGIATTIGFLLQFLLLTPATAALGIRYRPTLDFRHPAVRHLLTLGGPLFLYLVVAHASLLIERNLASRLSAGAVSTLTYAMRVFSVPANFLAAPLAIVAYPHFARAALRDSHGELRTQVSQTLRFVVFLFLPATIWTVLNALPIIRVLYERGQFRPEDSLVISRVLMLYGIGILPNAIAVILLRCFYAIQDTVTPLIAESIDLAFYLVTAPLLMRHFGIAGLAVTRGMTFFLVAAILGFVLWRRRGFLTINFDTFQFFARASAASVAMGAVSYVTFHLLQPLFEPGKTPLRLGVMVMNLLASAATFLAIARVLKLREAGRIVQTALDFVPGISRITR